MKKTISSIVTLLLVAAVVITMGIGSAWFTNWNFQTWFNSWGKGNGGETLETPKDDITGEPLSEDGLKINMDEEGAIPLSAVKISRAAYDLYGVSPMADTAYELIASVEPLNSADNSGVVWSLVGFKNPDSAWATGKNVDDYVSLSCDSSSFMASKRAIVSCKQAFGEPIEIMVSSEDDPTIKTTRRLDYVERITDFYAGFEDIECDFDTGITEFCLELGQTGRPNGGAAYVDVVRSSDPYTEKANYQVEYKLERQESKNNSNASEVMFTFVGEWVVSGDSYGLAFCTMKEMWTLERYGLFECNLAETGLIFSYDWMNENLLLNGYKCGARGASPELQSRNNIMGVIPHLMTENTYLDFFDLVVTLRGDNVELSKKTTFRMTSYRTTERTTGIQVSGGTDGNGNIKF